MSDCTFADCGRESRARGLCKAHWRQWRNGRALRPIRSADAVERFWSHVEKTDSCWLWTASKSRGYGKLTLHGRTAWAHRVAFEMGNGPIPKGMEIDHICRVPACVNPSHLRLATHKENSENHGVRSDNSSGRRGVTLRSDTGRFSGRVVHDGVQYSAGSFDTREQAHAAVSTLRQTLFTHSTEDAA